MILPESFIQIIMMAAVLTSVNAEVIEQETVIRDVGAAPVDVKTARDCQEIQLTSSLRPLSGVYEIKPFGVSEPFDVYCDFAADGGGWTVIQRRVDGSVDFDLGWNDYKVGFGNLETEFWLGNDKIHSITKQKSYQLRIELTNKYGTQYYAKYSQFSISEEDYHYRLFVGSYSGNSGHDSLELHNGMKFTTKDLERDEWDEQHNDNVRCAGIYRGGWWYNNCVDSVLNGRYRTLGLYWYGLTGSDTLSFSEMKIRAL